MLVLLEEPNVLILDEPGNDLDVDMLAAVEDMLDGWPGTLLLITHDRYLMERVTDNQYALINGHLRHLPGGIDEYLKIMKGLQAQDAPAASSKKGGKGEEPPRGEGLSNQELRALKKTLQSTERKMGTLTGKIDEAKQRLVDADPTDYQALGSIQEEITQLESQLEDLELTWLETSEALEA